MEVEVQSERVNEENGKVEIQMREVEVQDEKIDVENQDLGVHLEKVNMQTKEAEKIKSGAQKEEMNERSRKRPQCKKYTTNVCELRRGG